MKSINIKKTDTGFITAVSAALAAAVIAVSAAAFTVFAADKPASFGESAGAALTVTSSAVSQTGQTSSAETSAESSAKPAEGKSEPGFSGSFISSNGFGSEASLEIIGQADGSYLCSVRSCDQRGTYTLYSFTGKMQGEELAYTDGERSVASFREGGTFLAAQKIDSDHSGKLTMSEGKLFWSDSDGMSLTFSAK